MVYILLFYPKIYAAGKKQLSEYVELENNSKYIPKGLALIFFSRQTKNPIFSHHFVSSGVQIMLKPRQIAVYHPGHYSNGSYHSGSVFLFPSSSLFSFFVSKHQPPSSSSYLPKNIKHPLLLLCLNINRRMEPTRTS